MPVIATVTHRPFALTLSAIRYNPLAAACRAILAACCAAAAATAPNAMGAELPVACVAGSCGIGNPADFVSAGAASLSTLGNTLTINQTTDQVLLNWQSFNVSGDGTVNFVQPDSTSLAVNRIFQNTWSRIAGAINANGRIYLINQNGVLFADGARVNVGGLVASSLDLTPEALANGIARAAASSAPAFAAFASGSGAVGVEAGASITTGSGGQILMFAPEVSNAGTLTTPDGQTILAAGQRVYLTTSGATDPLRGLLVEVDLGGTVTNGVAGGATGRSVDQIVGQIVADRGNVTLAGLAVNQLGRVSASTSVRANGSVRLQARDTAAITVTGATVSLTASQGGALVLGADGVTEVRLPLDDAETTVDVNTQAASSITLDARTIDIEGRAAVRAPGGDVSIVARANPQTPVTAFPAEPATGRITIGTGAVIDVAGADIELPVERNVVRVELRGSQLADSPSQRNSALRGQTVFVDARLSGTREDGTTWQGTPIGDVAGDIAGVPRTVAERNLAGGTVLVASEGDIVMAAGATINVSGGSIRYQGGYVTTTSLLGADGRVYDIGAADPDRDYVGIVERYSVNHERWGVVETFDDFVGANGLGRYEAEYVEGKDAGSVTIAAPRAVIDGAIAGSVVAGARQRLPTQAFTGASLYRPVDQVPLGGLLQIGVPDAGFVSGRLNRIAPNVSLASGLVLPTLSASGGGPYDPIAEALPLALDTIRIRPELLGADGVSRVAIYANGAVTAAAGVSVSLPAGGTFAATAGSVTLDAAFTAPSGSVSLAVSESALTTQGDVGIDFGANLRVDLSGQWINDDPRLAAAGGLAPLYTSGGQFSATLPFGSVTLASGGTVDVSAGAWRDARGQLVAGRGGSVSLSLLPTTSSTGGLALGTSFAGYALENGGTFSLQSRGVCIAVSGCDSATAGAGFLALAPSFFEQGGFSSFALRTDSGGISVLPGTQVTPRQQNFVFANDATLVPSLTPLGDLFATAVLDDTVRRPTSLSLTARVRTPDGNPATDAVFATLPGLEIGSGAVIATDPGGRVSLASNSTLVVNGSVSAPAGSIELTLLPSLLTLEFLDTQAITLGPEARLLARGATRILTDDTGLRYGEVLAGGSVTLSAQRGFVNATAGSVIDVSGTEGTLDFTDAGDDGLVRRVARVVPSDAGSINISAAEGGFVSGQLLARAGSAPGAAGGSLSLVVDGGGRDDPGDGDSLFPTPERLLVVGTTQSVPTLSAGAALEPQYYGRLHVSDAQIAAGGFGSVALGARTLVTTQNFLPNFIAGAIRLQDGVRVSAGTRLSLDAAIMDPGIGTSLVAPYVSIGHSDRQYQSLAPTSPVPGTGSLTVNAQLIDVIGSTSFRNAASVALTSAGDIRLQGLQSLNGRTIAGTLTASANLTLTADQVYPTTFSDYTVRLAGVPGGTVRIAGRGTPGSVLSAGGSLTIDAPNIEQAGVLRAPSGEIRFNAGSTLVLESGSVTSTSTGGLTIPFGTIQAGNDWVLQLQESQTLVLDGANFPTQRVELLGPAVTVAQGALIDVSGGGDLLAYEFQPGVTGTVDVLSSTVRPGQFAILPSLALQAAPVDPLETPFSTLQAGESVYLSEMDGLPAGNYTLLPARYALLPGAFVVTFVEGYRDIQPGLQFRQLDGSTVIAGQRAVNGTDLLSARTVGVAVRPGTDVAREALYTTALASTFLPARAAALGTVVPRLITDAGTVAIAAQQNLILDGSLAGSHAAGTRGASLDLSGANIRVIGSTGVASVPGALYLTDTRLNTLGAESILLGGTRSATADGTTINVTAQSVAVEQGAQLLAPDLIFAATGTVDVAAGAAVRSGGTRLDADDLVVVGDGALLRVTNGALGTLERRTPANLAGSLTVAGTVGSTVAGGSVLFDASLNTQFTGQLELQNGALSIGASRINVGNVTGSPSGFTLDTGLISQLGLAELRLASRSSIDFYAGAALSARNLTLDSGGIIAVYDAPPPADRPSATINAGTLRLQNSAGAVPTTIASTNFGSLTVTADSVVVGPGRFDAIGFSNQPPLGPNLPARTAVAITAGQFLTLEDGALLNVASDLALGAARITTESGANAAIRATGVVTTALSQQAAQAATEQTLGGRVEISGSRIDHGGNLDVAAGQAVLAATGDIRLLAGSSINVGGRTVVFDGVSVSAPGGLVSLASNTGSVGVDAGATLNLAGAAGAGDAGTLRVSAANGTVSLAGTTTASSAAGSQGGSVYVNAFGLAEGFGELNRALNASGFNATRSIRLRGPGDIVVAAGDENAVRAERIELAADQGSIRIEGLVEARSATDASLSLFALNDIDVTGTVRTAQLGSTPSRSRTQLGVTQGGIYLRAGATIDLTGDNGGGDLMLRLPRASVLTVLPSAGPARFELGGTFTGIANADIEGLAAYDSATGTIGAAEVAASIANPLYNDAATFMAERDNLLAALGLTGNSAWNVLPGVELRSAGTLTLANAWDLGTWRFAGDVPGVLTLRSGGTLQFNQTLSDGFTGVAGNPAFLLTSTGESWSYRLAGGADLASSNPLALTPLPLLATGQGSVSIAGGTVGTATTSSTFRMIRTGTGFIDIAAGRDFQLGNRASVVYTAGIATQGVQLIGTNQLGDRLYPQNGGDISVSVQGDIRGAATPQLVSDWLWRTGRPSPPVSRESATGWTVNFQRFEQNIGALGGGNVTIEAGGAISNLSAVVPTIGRQIGGTALADSVVEVIGGGNLSVSSGGNLTGGNFYAGRGEGVLRSGGSIGQASGAFSPVLVVDDSRFSVTARQNLQLQGVVNSTLVPNSRAQGGGAQGRSFFTTYTGASGVLATAVAGDLTLVNDTRTSPGTWLASLSSLQLLTGENSVFSYYPPSLRAAALSGDVNVRGSMRLAADYQGNLELLAQDDVNVVAAGLVLIGMDDADPTTLPTLSRPQGSITSVLALLSGSLSAASPPVHSDEAQPDGDPDTAIARVVAQRGSILLNVSQPQSLFSIPKASRFVAGEDIVGMSLIGQNLRPGDVTSIIAGRDLIYPVVRSEAGIIQSSSREIALGGGGFLEVMAGRNVDLQTSRGISTAGNLRNVRLASATGADVSVLAGIDSSVYTRATPFVTEQVSARPELYGSRLVAFVARVTGEQGLDVPTALARFSALPDSVRLILARQFYLNELTESGRFAARSGSQDFSRGFAAIEALFPGANPDVDAGEVNAYDGNIRLFFSRVYTLAGGSIDLLAPGGEINVGLAAPPVAFGIVKAASELGIVAQSTGDVRAFAYRDFQVNESRVFAADGGSILVWSTRGDIDAGRGAKTAISAPPPVYAFDADGNLQVQFPPALAGSGIQTLATSEGTKPGNVDLFAPRGVVNAGDAGIVAGNLTVAATAVLGADNISVSGVAVGVPVDTGGLGASLAGVSSTASGASNAATTSVGAGDREDPRDATPLSESALSFLDVFVIGLGEDTCRPDDLECLKRQGEQQAEPAP